jgi:ABC-type antimicrobial peptide transport system permease subunit
LTALDLRGLARIEAVAAASVAAVGVAILGFFMVLERRRESAILRSMGATTRQVLTAPTLEGTIAVLGSLIIGIPIGIGLSILSIRVLGLFFIQPPPLVIIPWETIIGLSVIMIILSAVALAIALRMVARRGVATMLREP